MVKPMIIYLKERNIEKIQFMRGLDKEELGKFVTFLTVPKEEIKGNAQEALSKHAIEHIVVGKIIVQAARALTEEAQRSVSYLNRYEDSLAKVTASLESVLNGQGFDHLALRMTVNNVMENLLGRYQDFLNLAVVKRYDSKTFSHILNVSMLSMHFAFKIGFKKEEALEIGTAALFHDIGKLHISRKIIRKPGKLTDDEFVEMKSHVIFGTEILLKYVDTLGVLPVVVCFEHHLKYDLSGYPKTPFRRKPHIASLMVSICDVYDALSQRRGYKNDYPPKMIYELMIKERGASFEPELLDKFFKIIGVWPAGTIVSLNDGSVAVVREVNEDDIFAPKVEVIEPENKKELIDLSAYKIKLSIERSLNPLNEGKKYLPLI
ncbi:MAG: hypothetical protein A3J72_06670 [Nitrospirae bacterium RIFCSPHIGHO2_02_FULL_40_19]|nr:MAG: hypothetical protein A3J72_06670 [Nitrospirae bacterium RIFCSPHIGHO2_02_FULL_40_19]